MLNETKLQKQIDRLRQRKQNVLDSEHDIYELYTFTENMWNSLVKIHDSFAQWNKVFNFNINKME